MATKSPLQRVNTRTRLVVSEDGNLSREPVTLWLDPRDTPTFIFNIPAYVSAMLAVPAKVSASNSEKALLDYEKVIRKYAEWVRTKNAKPVILLAGMWLGRNEKGHHIEEDAFFFQDASQGWDRAHVAGIKYKLAFIVNGNLHWRDRDHSVLDEAAPNAYKVGMQVAHGDASKALDYTPALHAQLDRICDALNKAAGQLSEILTAKDVAKALTAARFPALEKK